MGCNDGGLRIPEQESALRISIRYSTIAEQLRVKHRAVGCLWRDSQQGRLGNVLFLRSLHRGRHKTCRTKMLL
jgi:hypothetical protein